MRRLRAALERLDEIITALEDRVEADGAVRVQTQKKQTEQVKAARAREASAIALAQKIGTRLDQTIAHVEKILQ